MVAAYTVIRPNPLETVKPIYLEYIRCGLLLSVRESKSKELFRRLLTWEADAGYTTISRRRCIPL